MLKHEPEIFLQNVPFGSIDEKIAPPLDQFNNRLYIGAAQEVKLMLFCLLPKNYPSPRRVPLEHASEVRLRYGLVVSGL
jgi:hypothetical protein